MIQVMTQEDEVRAALDPEFKKQKIEEGFVEVPFRLRSFIRFEWLHKDELAEMQIEISRMFNVKELK